MAHNLKRLEWAPHDQSCSDTDRTRVIPLFPVGERAASAQIQPDIQPRKVNAIYRNQPADALRAGKP